MENIFKRSFLEGYASVDITVESVILALTVTFFIGIYIFFVYRVLTRKTFYSKNFNISLVGVALITSAIIVTIQSSIVVSLGMVGALSIVRFRTAVKEPMDLAFMFWAISTGIICGAGLAEIACVLAFVLTVALFVLDRVPIGKAPQILMVSAEGYDVEKIIVDIVKKYSAYYTVKSRSLSNNRSDFVIELRIQCDKESNMMKEVSALPSVLNSSLLRHDGEVTV